MEKSTKTILTQIAIWAVTALIIGIVVKEFVFHNGEDRLTKDLKEVSAEVNKTCPVWEDSMSRFDNTVILPKHTFQYNYSIRLDTTICPVKNLKATLDTTLLESVKTDSSFEYFRENKVTIAFNYKDIKGHFLFKEEFSPERYLKK